MEYFLYLCARFMKIALIGYGKMGHMIESIALERGHKIVARIDVGDDFDLKDAQVAIEFTTPATAEENIRKAWEQGVPVISGSTGWRPEELRVEGLELREVDSRKLIVDSKTGKTMLVWSSNFSVGVNIFFEMNKFLAQKMKNLTPRGSMDVHRTSNRAEPFTRQGEGASPLWEDGREVSDFQLPEYDYVIDAIDSVAAKTDLIINATRVRGIKVFSSMGAALRFDPTAVTTGELMSIQGDALAKAVRARMKKIGLHPYRKVRCVYSTEQAHPCKTRGSLMQVTAVFGCTLASMVIEDLQKK